ncbi:hypothetical protein GF362_05850 [Candidatus Dojkabacteria bacterium]|nr:hypothetical protein [Candidatus Dojkabacteria bacterium]
MESVSQRIGQETEDRFTALLKQDYEQKAHEQLKHAGWPVALTPEQWLSGVNGGQATLDIGGGLHNACYSLNNGVDTHLILTHTLRDVMDHATLDYPYMIQPISFPPGKSASIIAGDASVIFTQMPEQSLPVHTIQMSTLAGELRGKPDFQFIPTTTDMGIHVNIIGNALRVMRPGATLEIMEPTKRRDMLAERFATHPLVRRLEVDSLPPHIARQRTQYPFCYLSKEFPILRLST